MRLRRLAAGLLASAAASSTAAAGLGFSLQASALAGTPWDAGQGGSARWAVEPRWRASLNDALELRAGLRLRWLRQQGESKRHADLRELSLQWRADESSLTLGSQQVNWGRMDIVRLTDAVNPVDQDDLFLEELPEAKRALWMANWEWQRDSRSLQVLLVPQPGVDRLGSTVQGLPVQVQRPSTSLRHAGAALRHGFAAGGWTADAVFVHGWQTAPQLQPSITPTGPVLLGGPVRLSGFGGSADRPVGAVVLRLEGWLARLRPERAAAGRLAALGAGFDWRAGNTFAALQLVALRQSAPASAAWGPGDPVFASVVVQHKALQDRLTLRASHLRESARSSSWTSLQLSYELTEHQLLRLQADRFAGDAASALGAFGARSRVAASIRLQY